jgi:hypothetical protein
MSEQYTDNAMSARKGKVEVFASSSYPTTTTSNAYDNIELPGSTTEGAD